MSFPRLAIRRPVGVSMLFIGAVLAGLLSFFRLPVDLLPDVSHPVLVVQTTYPEAAPAEVERLVTAPVEQALAMVRGVRGIESTTEEGLSLVTVRFAWGTEMDFAALNVRERLDDLRGALPETASRPVLLHTDPRSEPVLILSIAGRSVAELTELAEAAYKRRLEQIEGVAQAALVGVPEREIHVEAAPERLESYGLTLSDVTRALAEANVSAPAGVIRRGQSRYALRTLGQFQSVSEIAGVPIRPGAATGPVPGAAGVTVGDVARVHDAFRERESITRFNGREAVALLVFKNAGANTVAVAERVTEVVADLRREYPSLQVDVASNQATFIQDALTTVVQEVALGGLLAFLVLFFFLHNPRYPVVVALAIPICVVVSFALLHLFGVTLNVLSLGGLALGVGMLMDNSIVVLENIFRHRERGLPAAAAAALGAEEVQRAITASTLTTVAVFGPIVYIEGAAGQLLRALAFSVGCSLLASIAVAATLLPMLASRIGGDPAGGGTGRGVEALPRVLHRPLLAFDRGWARFARGYERLLVYGMRHRAGVLAFAGVLLAAGVAVGASLERSILPQVDQGSFRVRLTLPRGTPVERTAEVARSVEAVLRSDAAVEVVLSRIGRQNAFAGVDTRESGLHTALLDVRLRPGERTAPAVARVRPKLGSFAGSLVLESGQTTSLGRLLGGSDADLAVRVRGGDPRAALEYAERIRERAAAIPALANVRASTGRGQPELQVEIDRDRAAAFGIDPERISDAIEASTRGRLATQFLDFDRKVPVVVRLPRAVREDLAAVQSLRLDGVPLGELAVVHERFAPAQIQRRDQVRFAAVYADVARGGIDDAAGALARAVRELPAPPGMRAEVEGENDEMADGFRQLALAFALSLLLVYMLLAIEFESLLHPFIILIAVPLALVGSAFALWITGAGLNTMSLIGVVILVGIVDNDAVVKVDFINQMRREGMSRNEAIFAAGRARLRPIVMNTATAMLGLLPLALGLGAGAELQAPLAIAVFGGLLSATALTLVVIPVSYDILDEAGARARAWWSGTPPRARDGAAGVPQAGATRSALAPP